jgi:hypothetical protein
MKILLVQAKTENSEGPIFPLGLAHLASFLPVDALRFDVVCPHPGTEALRFLKEKYKVEKINWETFNVYSSPYHLSDLSSQEVYKILKWARLRNLFTIRELKRKFGKILGS